MNDRGVFDSTDDDCPYCGANMQATHAPWCEERDGTPVDPTSPAYFAGKLAAALVANHEHLCSTQPDWWQLVLIELHDRLQNELLFNRDYQDAPSPSWLERRTLVRFGSYVAQRYQLDGLFR